MKQFQKENYFTKIEKKIEMNSIMEFPSLSDVMLPLQNKEKRNYVDMFLTEKYEEDKDVYLPGWLYISMDKDRKVKKIMNGNVYEIPKYNGEEKDIELLNKTEYNKKAIKVISEMIKNWENYKTWYTNLYGEDCYEKMYEMVRKEDDIIYEDEYDEDDNLNQDNTHTDEDEDYL